MIPNFNGPLFLVLLIGHLLGDYYFQTERLAKEKQENCDSLLIHSLIYSIPIVLACIFMQLEWGYFFIAAISHWLIDTWKWNKEKKRKYCKRPDSTLYIIDQILHLLFIILITIKNPKSILCLPIPNTALGWIALVLLIWKPANISFDILFQKYANAAKIGNLNAQTSSEQENLIKSDIEGAGAKIGFLERLLVVALVYFRQFSALGFLIATKSMARYEKITKVTQFAEYYLIGTLYSFSYAIIAYMLIFLVILSQSNPIPSMLLHHLHH